MFLQLSKQKPDSVTSVLSNLSLLVTCLCSREVPVIPDQTQVCLVIVTSVCASSLLFLVLQRVHWLV